MLQSVLKKCWWEQIGQGNQLLQTKEGGNESLSDLLQLRQEGWVAPGLI